MLKNYLKIARRTLLRKRVFSMVNVLGLSVGLASCIIISAYLISEISFDSFHRDADRIFRVVEHINPADQDSRDVASVGGAIGIRGQAEIAGVADYMRILELGVLNLKYKDNEFGEPFFSFDGNFFEFFDFPLIAGDPKTVLKDSRTLVVNETTAKRLFGEEDPVGKTIQALTNQGNFDLMVTGVMKDMPENSHLNFGMIFSHDTPDSFFNGFLDYYNKDWQTSTFATYLKLDPNVDPTQTAASISDLVRRNRPENNQDGYHFNLQPLNEVHFRSSHIDDDLNHRKGDLDYVYIFLFIGALILLIAFTNYVNLSTIKATDRIKEIGLRRVVGASRSQLIVQFMSESVFFSLISLAIAFTLIQFSGPLVNLLFDSNLLDFIYTTEYMLLLFCIVLILGLSAGLYPALVVVKARTVQALKNQTVGGGRQAFFRGVVLFQFVTSLAMIVATLIVRNQLNYINNKDLGYDKEAIALIEINSNQARQNQGVILSEFRKTSGIVAASAVSRVPAEWKPYYEISVKDEQAREFEDIPFIGADEYFLDIFDIDLISGRNFRTDGSDSLKVLINETMARQLGMEDVHGKVVQLSGAKRGAQVLGLGEFPSFEVIGVINDFHFQSLREEIPPMMFGYRENPIQNIDYFVVKLNTAEMGKTLEELKAITKQFDPSPFDYNFLDDRLDRYYVEDTKRSNLFFIASSIAVFIAFIGLFALVHFALQKRLKEMSIRKVLGANINSLFMLLSKDYIRLLLIALLLAAPLSYWGMSSWLNEFVYRTDISWWVFGLALAICLFITGITAFTQINKTARRNPAEILRQE